MLAIQSSGSSAAKCTPNVIPCRIHHTGPTKITKRYWAPHDDKDNVPTSYFRGRKLRGRTIKLPARYQGLILSSTDKQLLQSRPANRMPQYEEDDEIDQEEPEELDESVKILEKTATFDKLVIWGHDQVPESDDPFVRNVEEWIVFAEAIHCNNPVRIGAANGQNDSTATSE